MLCKSDSKAADCNLGDSGIEHILEFDWTTIRKLDLSNFIVYSGHNKLTDASMEKLATRNWSNLVSLHLAHNSITDKGVELLMKAKFPELKSLWLSKG